MGRVRKSVQTAVQDEILTFFTCELRKLIILLLVPFSGRGQNRSNFLRYRSLPMRGVAVVGHDPILTSSQNATGGRVETELLHRQRDKDRLVPLGPRGVDFGYSCGLWKPFDQGWASSMGKEQIPRYIPNQRGSRKMCCGNSKIL
jgi:hypothetical protein